MLQVAPGDVDFRAMIESLERPDNALPQPHQRLFIGVMIQPEKILKPLHLRKAFLGNLHITIESGIGLRIQFGAVEAARNQTDEKQGTNTNHSSNIGRSS